jgi:tellurite resistance protein TerC
MENSTTLWIGFNVFILIMLVLDLGVFHRKAHKVSIREALTWTCVWVGLAFAFNIFV